MFFPDRIRHIGRGDHVLEIGPGGTPHPRANVLLERQFSDEEAQQQRGGTLALATTATVVFYDGGRFPFANGEFDYVICSHVIEHVEHVEAFCAEMFRVARRGYIEFPTIYYEYLYNFSVHIQLVHFEAGELRYMPKRDSGMATFQPIQALFYRSLELGYSELVQDLKSVMVQGFEWGKPFSVRRVLRIEDLTVNPHGLAAVPCTIRNIRSVSRWIERHFQRLRRVK